MKLERLLASCDSEGGIFQVFVEISSNGEVLKGVGFSEESEKEAIWQAIGNALKGLAIELGGYQGIKDSQIMAFAEETVLEASVLGPG